MVLHNPIIMINSSSREQKGDELIESGRSEVVMSVFLDRYDIIYNLFDCKRENAQMGHWTFATHRHRRKPTILSKESIHFLAARLFLPL